MKAKEKMVKARVGLVLDSCFFGSLALGPNLKEDTTCKTLWTDGKTIGYNPKFVDSLRMPELKGTIAHEAMHIGAGHHARRQGRNAKQWNIACDYAINDILINAGFTLPAGALSGFGTDLSAEAIYANLPPPQDGGSDGDQDPGGCGEVRDVPGDAGKPATPSEIAKAQSDAKVAVSQAEAAAKMMGNMPAGLDRFVEQTLETRVPWREVTRRFIDQAAHNDYTWTRPNRRYMQSGFYLPSLYNQEMRPLVIIADTSGSILGPEFDQFGAEISAIIEDTHVEATVMYVDAGVANVETFSPDCLPVVLHPAGGGGTDFRPGFAEVERLGLAPSCLIYLTDGECNRFPEQAPEYPVLWAVNRPHFSPPFGETIEII